MYIGVQKFFGVSQDFINPSENYGRVKADKTKITRATLSNKFEKYVYISGVLGAHGHKIIQFFHYFLLHRQFCPILCIQTNTV